MPCILRTLHSNNYYTHDRHLDNRNVSRVARSAAESTVVAAAEKKSPGFVADSAHDVAALALMIVFFALLGTAIVLAAVYFSKRALDRECRRQPTIRLRTLTTSDRAEEEDPKALASMTESSRPSSLQSTKWKFELPRLQAERAQLHGDGRRETIRDRRGMPELVWPNVRTSEAPRLPPLAFRLEPRAVFPGARPYGMGQIGNDGRVHRPESIFEYVRP